MSKPWTDRDREVAHQLRSLGYQRQVIAERLGRSKLAISKFFDRAAPSCAVYGGEDSLGSCAEERRLRRNAIRGSQRLASTIKMLGLRP